MYCGSGGVWKLSSLSRLVVFLLLFVMPSIPISCMTLPSTTASFLTSTLTSPTYGWWHHDYITAKFQGWCYALPPCTRPPPPLPPFLPWPRPPAPPPLWSLGASVRLLNDGISGGGRVSCGRPPRSGTYKLFNQYLLQHTMSGTRILIKEKTNLTTIWNVRFMEKRFVAKITQYWEPYQSVLRALSVCFVLFIEFLQTYYYDHSHNTCCLVCDA